MARRQAAMGRPEYEGLAVKDETGRAKFCGKISFMPEQLEGVDCRPRVTKRGPGRRAIVFMVSMGDLFHVGVYPAWRTQTLAAMFAASQHDYVLCTKRPGAMRAVFSQEAPRHNWWLLASVEDQDTFNTRWAEMRELRNTLRGRGLQPPVMGISAEPLLGPISLFRSPAVGGYQDMPDWVIAGPETGPKARPCKDEWIEALARESNCFFDKREGLGRRREWPE
jgi:protein gp37